MSRKVIEHINNNWELGSNQEMIEIIADPNPPIFQIIDRTTHKKIG
jgi:hypothetical protein